MRAASSILMQIHRQKYVSRLELTALKKIINEIYHGQHLLHFKLKKVQTYSKFNNFMSNVPLTM